MSVALGQVRTHDAWGVQFRYCGINPDISFARLHRGCDTDDRLGRRLYTV